MASNTPNIDLYKKNTAEDLNDTFNIDTMLNENWDKIDESIGDIQNDLLADSIKTIYESNSNTNAYTDTEKSKLAGIENNANNYHHPSTHPASMINEETNRNFMTSSERTKLADIEDNANNYHHPSTHPASMINEEANRKFITSSEKTKLAGIDDNANNYNHPSTHPASMINEETDRKFITSTEKTKLAGIDDNANNYHHPSTHPASIINEETNRKFMTSSEKTKLADIESGAEVNNLSDANVTDLTDGGNSSLHYHSNDRNRANHTGTQLASTISNFFSTVRGTVLTGLSTAANSAITATDSMLSALGKLQAQITSLGSSKLDVNANAVSASKLKTARTISLAGDVTGSVSFDGSANKSITATVANDSHTHDSRYYTEPEINTKLSGKSDSSHNHNGVYEPANSNIFKKKIDISSGVDLNTVTTDGYYHQNSNASAAAGSNYPVDYAGMLTVKTDGLMVYHTYQIYNTGEIWTRSKYNSTWYSWRKVWDSLNDGGGSGLDSDKLDGQHGSYYLNMDNMSESSTKKVMTDSERTKLAGIQTGAQVNKAISDSVTSTSSTTTASSKAAKTAYDKGVEALNIANTKLNSSGGTITGDLSVQGDIKLMDSESMIIGSEGNDYIKFNPNTDALEVYSNSAKTLEVSGSTIKYEGNNIWHAGNDGNGSGLDADKVDGKEAIGTLSTTEKTNLVSAINEVNSKTTALETEISNSINQQTLTLTNADSTQHITAKQNCGVDVEIGGEMVVNLLGGYGNFEKVNIWNSAGTLDSSVKVFGSGSLKIDNTGGSTEKYCSAYDKINLKEGKYFISAYSRKDTNGTINSSDKETQLVLIGNNIYAAGYNIATTNKFERWGFTVDVMEDDYIVRVDNNENNVLFTDGFMINKIPDDNNLTIDQLLAKYPYTNSAQPLFNPTVEMCGKNLSDINNVDCLAGCIISNKTQNSITFKSSSAATYQYAQFRVNVKKNTAYSIGVAIENLQGSFNPIYLDVVNSEGTALIGTSNAPINTGENDDIILRIFVTAGTPEIGEVKLSNLILSEGTTPTPYEPYKGGQIIFPTELAKIDSYQDKLTYKDGVAKVDREVKHVVLDGNLDYWTQANYTGYKNIALQLISDTIESLNTLFAVKYNGKILQSTDTYTEYDRCYPAGGSSYITIANTDSGWGEDYIPTSDEIKAYFNGWRMSNVAATADSQVMASTPEGNKVWSKIYSGTGTPYILPTNGATIVVDCWVSTCPATVSDSTWTPYQLYYALQQPVQEEIQPIILSEGINLVEGQNALMVKSGTAYQKIEPQADATNYYINLKGYTVLPKDCNLNHKVISIITIYKEKIENGIKVIINDTSNWNISSLSSFKYGNEYAYISNENYDPQAAYYVLYQVLQEDYNCQVQAADISYEDNIRGALNEAVEEVHNIQSNVSQLQLMNVDTNLKGDGERIERGSADSTGSIVFGQAFLEAPTILLTAKSSTTPYVNSVTTTSFTLEGAGAYWVAIGK